MLTRCQAVKATGRKKLRVQPLQIVEKQRKRVLRPGERAEESPEHHLEAVLRILRRQVWNGRLFPDDKLDLRDEVDDELAIRTHGLPRYAEAARKYVDTSSHHLVPISVLLLRKSSTEDQSSRCFDWRKGLVARHRLPLMILPGRKR